MFVVVHDVRKNRGDTLRLYFQPPRTALAMVSVVLFDARGAVDLVEEERQRIRSRDAVRVRRW